MALRFSKRYAGREAEILRDIRLHGTVAAMLRWGAHDPLAWDKYVASIRDKASLVTTARPALIPEDFYAHIDIAPGAVYYSFLRRICKMSTEHPVKLTIAYPDKDLNRLTTFFRIFTVIPIMIILGLVTGPTFTSKDPNATWQISLAAGSILFLPTLLMILFRQKYPRWWFEWNVNITKFAVRVLNYFLLLTDVYPSTDEDQGVHLEIPYPDTAKDISSWMPLVKWFLAIPHYIVLGILMIAVFVVWIITWFAILFTGRYPRSFFDFVVGVFRWYVRVLGYALILATDVYPPFSLEP